jgi:hypothetical protein
MSGVLLVRSENGEQWITIKHQNGRLPCSLDLYYEITTERNDEPCIEITQKISRFDTTEARKKAVEDHQANIKRLEREMEECKDDLVNEEAKAEPDAKLIGKLYLKKNQIKTKMENLAAKTVLDYDEIEVNRSVKIPNGSSVCLRIIGNLDKSSQFQLVTMFWLSETDVKQNRVTRKANCDMKGDPLSKVEDKVQVDSTNNQLDKLFSKSLFDDASSKLKPAPVTDDGTDWILDQHSSTIALGGGQLVATNSTLGHNWVIGSKSFSSGTHCWEAHIDALQNNIWIFMGVCYGIPNINNSYEYKGTFGVASGSQIYRAGKCTSEFNMKYSAGDTVRMRLDCSRGTITLKNVNTNQLFELTGLASGQAYYPHFNLHGQNDQIRVKPIIPSAF